MTVKLNAVFDVNSDSFLDLSSYAKCLWLYLWYDATTPTNDLADAEYNNPKAICRMLDVDEDAVEELLNADALTLVETEG